MESALLEDFDPVDVVGRGGRTGLRMTMAAVVGYPGDMQMSVLLLRQPR
jgi:hypothetical protein